MLGRVYYEYGLSDQITRGAFMRLGPGDFVARELWIVHPEDERLFRELIIREGGEPVRITGPRPQPLRNPYDCE